MKIRLAQINPTIGDLQGNSALIEQTIADAENDTIDLLIFPELAVCGYIPLDLLERPAFLDDIYQTNEELVDHSRDTAVLFGTVTPNESETGRSCFNSAILARDGKVQAEVHKALLPTYDVYNELRYFEPDNTFECVEFEGHQLGITVCEDIWHNFELPYITYDINPTKELINGGAEAIFNLSASPYTRNKPAKRKQMLCQRAREFNVPVFYVNQVGSNTELISDGDSMVIDHTEDVIARAPLFEETAVDVHWNPKEDVIEQTEPPAEGAKPIEQMFGALQLGLRDYLEKTQITDKVVVGLSGGIDSALVAVIAVEALGAENVVGITMPSKFSSEGSVTDSQELAQNLGISCHEIVIKDIYKEFTQLLHPFFEDTEFGTAEENIQPRIRGTLLMAYSNKFRHMLLNTGNKSELAIGYCTLYGDMSGGLSMIGDLYKSEVYEMARWLNNVYFDDNIIPPQILRKPPSAELRPDQADTDSLPEYDTLDAILKAYIEEQVSIDVIADRGYDPDLIKRIISLVDNMEYKRFQGVPILKVSDKAFGSGRNMPVVQQWSHNFRD
ncbi:NAD+ synthase (glutamine-hydrolysing) [Fodinibius salinus]|uniref:Glutamine-dependent NAD(+) synthetase n=1 Tax=Fodinibius salinus TaxID=860790 RepID=A0A5D3YHC0_9BACT|nr:NAD+ synthase [Fodinibius salinus]TYP92589.1 NAD+ synthase (glutamine-hydrolysing) [Fodinibius salinus]